MVFDWSTFLLQTANFAVLVWLLHRFLYRPVLAIIAARKTEIDRQYQQSATAKSAAQAQLASAAAERAGMAAERDALLARAAAQAEQAGAARQAEASRDAARLLEDARKTIAAERAAALAEARRVAVELAREMASRLLEEIPAGVRTEGWLEKVEQYLAALPAAAREGLALQLAGGAPVRVVSALPLPETARELWRQRLAQALHCDLAVQLASDPGLIAGVELHFPAAILQLTWKSQLAALRLPQAPGAQTTHVDAR